MGKGEGRLEKLPLYPLPCPEGAFPLTFAPKSIYLATLDKRDQFVMTPNYALAFKGV